MATLYLRKQKGRKSADSNKMRSYRSGRSSNCTLRLSALRATSPDFAAGVGHNSCTTSLVWMRIEANTSGGLRGDEAISTNMYVVDLQHADPVSPFPSLFAPIHPHRLLLQLLASPNPMVYSMHRCPECRPTPRRLRLGSMDQRTLI